VLQSILIAELFSRISGEFMSELVQLSFTVNRDVFAALRQDPEQFVPELRLTASAKWYEFGVISQSKVAEITGLFHS
jgi:Uncharacterised protein family (UPF0175)